MLVPVIELFICLFKDSVSIAQHITLNINMYIIHTVHHLLNQSWPSSIHTRAT